MKSIVILFLVLTIFVVGSLAGTTAGPVSIEQIREQLGSIATAFENFLESISHLLQNLTGIGGSVAQFFNPWLANLLAFIKIVETVIEFLK